MAWRRWLILAAPIVIYVALAAPLLRAPLRWDETDAPPQADAILRHGVPRIPASETNLLAHPHSLIASKYNDVDYGLWHPPLYLYLESATRWALGRTDVANRLLNLGLGAGGVAAIVWAARREAKDRGWSSSRVDAVGLLAGGLIATCPFWLSGTMRVDIDGPLLSLIEVVAVALTFRAKPDGDVTVRTGAVFGSSFLLLWAKPPGYVLFVLGIATLLMLASRWDLLRRFVLVATASACAFAISWLVFTRVGNLPWRFPLDFTYLRKGAPALSPSVAVNTARYNLAFIGLAIVCLAAATVIAAVRESTTRLRPLNAFISVGLVSVAYYTLAWGTAGKYTVPLVGLFVVAISVYVVERTPLVELRAFAGRRPFAVPAIGLFVFAAFLLAGDAVTLTGGRHSAGFSLRSGLHDHRFVAMSAGAVVLCGVVLSLKRWQRTWTQSLIAGAVLAAVCGGLAQHALLLRHADQTLVLAPEHESGFGQTIEWIDAHLDHNGVVLTYKEVAFHSAMRRVVPVDRAINFTPAEVDQWLREGRIRYAVLRTDDASSFPISGTFSRLQVIGSWSVYARD